MRRPLAIVLMAVAIAVGIKVGLWEAHFWVEGGGCNALPVAGIPRPPCPPPIARPQFARWLCALLGAGAAAVIALIALAIDRWPKPSFSN